MARDAGISVLHFISFSRCMEGRKAGVFSGLFVGLFFSLPSELSPCLGHVRRIAELHLPLFALHPTH